MSPHQLPGAGAAAGPAPLEIPHGTTVVAIRYADGVVMAGDRRATAGYTIANRRIEKVFAADDFSGVAIAGAAGPAIEMVKLFQTQLEHYEKVQGEVLSLEGKANQLGMMVRGNLPAAMQGLAVVPLFAGYDQHRETRPRLLLRRHRRPLRRAGLPGPGLGQHPRPQLDQGRVGRRHVARRHRRTRDPGAVRRRRRGRRDRRPRPRARHLPVVAAIDANGFRALDEADVEARSRALLDGPRTGR